MASLGAVTTILMLTFSTFTQQALQIDLGERPGIEPAWAEATTNYSLLDPLMGFGPNCK